MKNELPVFDSVGASTLASCYVFGNREQKKRKKTLVGKIKIMSRDIAGMNNTLPLGVQLTRSRCNVLFFFSMIFIAVVPSVLRYQFRLLKQNFHSL